jgi:hypothetical protein
MKVVRAKKLNFKRPQSFLVETQAWAGDRRSLHSRGCLKLTVMIHTLGCQP